MRSNSFEEAIQADETHQSDACVQTGAKNDVGQTTGKDPQPEQSSWKHRSCHRQERASHEQVSSHQVLQIDYEGVGGTQVQGDHGRYAIQQ